MINHDWDVPGMFRRGVMSLCGLLEHTVITSLYSDKIKRDLCNGKRGSFGHCSYINIKCTYLELGVICDLYILIVSGASSCYENNSSEYI